MDKKQREQLDQLSIAEIDAYLKARRRDEYLSRGTVDGWERTPMDIEMPMEAPRYGVTIEDGSWIWHDEEGRIRRAFGYFGDSYPAAMTFDEEGQLVHAWELQDDDSLMAQIGNPDLDDDDHLALVRASVMASPITREQE